MNSVSRFARRFCTTLSSSPATTTIPVIEASSVSVPKNIEAPSVSVPKKKAKSVYSKLSKLSTTGGNINQTLNQFIMEGHKFDKHGLIRYVKHLRSLRQPQRALEVFEWMESKEIAFSGSDHAVRLDLIGKTKGLEEAESYFNSLESSMKMDKVYGSLLNCYCMKGEEEKAKTHFDVMSGLNLVTSCLPFNNMMAMYLRIGQPEKVPELVVAMKERGISPGDVTYSMWMQGCGNLNDIEGVDKVLEEWKASGQGPSSWDTFATLATIYSKAGEYSKTEAALKSLEEKLNPDKRDSYHLLISLYAGISNASEVYRVWDLLKKRHPKVNNASCYIMVQALSKLNDLDGIKKIFAEWESTCWSYDMRMGNVMISSYLKENMYEEAEAVFESAVKKCKGQSSLARQLLMIHLLKNDRADLAVKHFKAAVLEKDENWTWISELVRLFFLHFEQSKDVDGAEEFCKTLTKWSPQDSETYTLLIKTYIDADKACPGMRKRLEDQGIKIDSKIESLLSKISS